MLTPRQTLIVLRAIVVGCAVALATLMLGPYEGLEKAVGLSDKTAHVLAFFLMTLGLFTIAPRTRRSDLCLAALAASVVSELLQGLTGRTLSITDLGADLVGIGCAMLPGAIEGFRRLARVHPDLTFAQSRLYDRRAARSAEPRSAASRAVPSRPARSPSGPPA